MSGDVTDNNQNNQTVIQKIKDAMKEDPAFVIFAASSLIFSTAKFIDCASMAKNRRIQNKQAKHYFKQAKKRPLMLEPLV